ncbi:hypothetical protein ACHAP3_010700 [Botrytis cinerea]
MVDSTPATIDPLISCCLEYLKEWPGVKSLYIARAINYEQIETLDHCGIKYLNGVIGLGLASILTSEESSHHYKHNHQIDWHPLEISLTYSTIELLAQVELHGAISLAKLPGIVYKDLPLTTRVLIAFSEVKLESHENAQHMLGSVFPEVKMVYGFQSMEVFLVGTTLANCLNRCRMEALAEGLVSSTFRKAVSRLEVPTTAQEFLIRLSIIPDYYTNSELSMVVAFADSLIGQGKHDDAMSLFQAILKKRRPGREEVTMSVALRMSKINRRLNTESQSLKLLMAETAPEFIAGKMTQHFPSASEDLIRKISQEMWKRFKRIQEIRAMPEIDDIPDAKESLNYRDSGLGSSVKTTCNILESSNNSVISYRSFISNDTKSIPLPQMPETVKSEGQFLCFVCEKTIKGITSEAQYRRHIWADIRPYVCPVKGCDADANQFLSRTDFGAHLKEHHSTNSLGNKSTEHISTLRCPFCNELPGEVAIIGHICHHLEVESCSVFSQDIGEEVENNGLNMTLSSHDIVQEPFQLNPDQKYSQPHETRRSAGDTKESLLKHDEPVNTDSLFTNAWPNTQPITQYTEQNDNNDGLPLKASTEITGSPYAHLQGPSKSMKEGFRAQAQLEGFTSSSTIGTSIQATRRSMAGEKLSPFRVDAFGEERITCASSNGSWAKRQPDDGRCRYTKSKQRCDYRTD